MFNQDVQIHWFWKNKIQIYEEFVSGFKFNPTLVSTAKCKNCELIQSMVSL